jgi:hypothetical protein
VQVDQKEIILEKINPYLDKLETLVGKEVCLKEFLPNFKKDNYFKFAFNIPDTKYCFSFNEYENVGEYRTTGIKILGDGMNLGSAGGPTLTDLCEVGRLTYEGRLRPI